MWPAEAQLSIAVHLHVAPGARGSAVHWYQRESLVLLVGCTSASTAMTSGTFAQAQICQLLVRVCTWEEAIAVCQAYS